MNKNIVLQKNKRKKEFVNILNWIQINISVALVWHKAVCVRCLERNIFAKVLMVYLTTFIIVFLRSAPIDIFKPNLVWYKATGMNTHSNPLRIV